MADKQSIAVLNIGAQRVGMALFKQVKGVLVLTNYKSTEILADPAAASSRNAQIKIAVSELAHALKVKNRVSYAVSGQSVFTRFVRLPDLDGVDVEELVTNEAQQHIPFPLEEVRWDWAEVTEIDGEKEVVIAAIKSRILNEIQDAVEGAGMTTTEVAPSPMSLYNAFRMSYPDMDEPCMLIDIGAKTSNVIYIDGARVFNRSIAIGGATVTTAISKEYDIPFLEAEGQKKSNGMVALDTRHTSKLDELTGALATCIRTSLNRMPAEIARTTNFYRSQQGGSAPKKVFIAGGGSNLPNMSQFLQEKLRLPVEYFNPLRGISVDKDVDVEALSKDSHLLGELVGLVTRVTGKSTLRLDLVPDSVAKEKDLDKRKSKLLLAGGALVLGLLVFWIAVGITNSSLKEHRNALKASHEEMKPFADQMQAVIATEKSNAPVFEELVEVQESRVFWVDALNELKQKFASNKYWFTEFTPIVDYGIDDLHQNATPQMQSDALKSGRSSARGSSQNKKSYVNAVLIKGVWLKGDHNLQVTMKKWLGEPETENKGNVAMEKAAPSKNTSRYYSSTLSHMNKGTLTKSPFSNKKIFKIKTEFDVGKLGSSFSIILPLKNPILIK